MTFLPDPRDCFPLLDKDAELARQRQLEGYKNARCYCCDSTLDPGEYHFCDRCAKYKFG